VFEHPAQVRDAVAGGFGNRPVLVVGDLILDRYLWGEVNRISPESPVPVVLLVRENEVAGGAANVAVNLAGLGLKVAVAGYVGRDANCDRLRDLLRRENVDTGSLVGLNGWGTITKTRIISGHQQMLRIDREILPQPTAEEIGWLLYAIEQQLAAGVSAVILSDYAKGVLSAPVCQRIISAARSKSIPVLVDPKGQDYEKYRRATAISPNRQELAAACHQPAQELENLLSGGQLLMRQLQLDFLAVTLSGQGIALVEEDRIRRIPAQAREVFDVSGAGDTVIAVLAAGLLAGLDRLDALRLANLAAGVVVGKVGTAPIRRDELLKTLSAEQALEQSEKICSLPELLTRVETWRARGERLVFTNGCFDLLHAGHVAYIEKARRLGSRLVIGLNTDRSVRALKGEGRPIIKEGDRARVLAALAAVDAVVLFDEETPLTLIRALRPEVLAKGADYTEEQVVGGSEVKAWGGDVALVELVNGKSSSLIVRSIQGAEGRGQKAEDRMQNAECRMQKTE